MGYVRRSVYTQLQKILGFDPWHIDSYDLRPYAAWTAWKLTRMLEDGRLEGGDIIEIGCGLGDVVSHVGGLGRRIGYDVAPRVIWGARLIHPCTSFHVGTFSDVSGQKFSAAIAVDFLHYIPPARVNAYFEQFLTKNEVSLLVVDQVESPPYQYAQDFVGMLAPLHYQKVYTSRGFASWGGTRRHILFFQREPASLRSGKERWKT